MATLDIKVETKACQPVLQKIAAAIDAMPEARRDLVLKDMAVLEAAGAQWFDVGFCYGMVYVYPSDDLRGVFHKFGVEL